MAGNPLALHPKNPRRFLFRGKPAVLVTSGEHYGAVLNMDFDYRAYLAELASHGLNNTRLFSGAYIEVPGEFSIVENTLAPAPGRWACPWARSGTPGAKHGGNKFDLSRLDAGYLARLKDFMEEASRRGVVVEYNFFCPLYHESLWEVSPMNKTNNVNGVGSGTKDQVYTLEEPALTALQEALFRGIVAELAPFDNLYYEVCNEPYCGKVARAWQDRMVEAIREAEAGLTARHLISYNIANFKAKAEPNPGVSIYNFHYCVPPEVVEINAGLEAAIGENETGFRGWEDAKYRSEGWDFMFAGGSLYNNLDYSFKVATPRGDKPEPKSPGGGSRALRKQLGILKAFLEGFDLIRLKPSPEILRGDLRWGVEARCLAEEGGDCAVYVHRPFPEKYHSPAGGYPGARELPPGPESVSLSLEIPAGAWRVEWLDPATGEVTDGSHRSHSGGPLAVESPKFPVDVAMRVTREGRT